MLLEKQHLDRRGIVPIVLLPQSVPLVVGKHGPHRPTGCTHLGGDLQRFGEGNPRVVTPVHQHQSRTDLVRTVQGADALEDGAHGRIPFVAILGPTQVLPIRAGPLQEGDEAGNADAINSRAQPIASGVHFFGTLPILPYKMGLQTPNECVYALGYYRPGSCAPYMIDPLPFTWRAALFEAGAWVGGAAVVP